MTVTNRNEENEVPQQEATTTAREIDMEVTSEASVWQVFLSLLWLDGKLLLHDYRKYIIIVVALAIWIFNMIILGIQLRPMQCPDGSYSFMGCIDNDNPPTWYVQRDSQVVDCLGVWEVVMCRSLVVHQVWRALLPASLACGSM